MISGSTIQNVSGQSIYKNKENKDLIYQLYDEKLSRWPVPYEILEIATTCGMTSIIASGDTVNPPVLLFHPAGLTATVWLPNIKAISENYRVYAINTLGDLGKSELYDYDNYLKKGLDYNDWINEILDELGIDTCDVIAGSMGGWIAMNFAVYSPDRINHLILLGPAGIKSDKFTLMKKLSKVLLFPSRKNKEAITKWVLGDSEKVNDELAIYMNTALYCESRIPYPGRIKKKQLEKIQAKTLLILGEFDAVVGQTKKNQKYAQKCFKDIEIEIVKSGHIISMEKSEQVNQMILEFLSK